MNRFFIFFFVSTFCAGNVRAQFFNFGFGDPFSQRQQVQREVVTRPEYKGGNDKLNAYLLKHYKNPPRENVSGQIVVSCVISEKGKVIETAVKSPLRRPYDEEAVRVARKLHFKPAKQGKKKIKSRFDVVFPIRSGRLSFLNLKTVEV